MRTDEHFEKCICLFLQVMCCCRKKLVPQKKEEEEEKWNKKKVSFKETWTTTDNARDPSEERGRDETSYFDPSYDYMYST